MIIEPIEKTNSTEFAQICLKWLNSNEPTLTVKDRNGNREKNVPEDSLFATLEEAEARCKELIEQEE